MIKLEDLLKVQSKDLLMEYKFHDVKALIQSNAKDAKLPSEYVEFKFVYHGKNALGKGPKISCIPKSSKDLDKIDNLGSISKDDITKQLAKHASKKTKQKFIPIDYRHFDQYTLALDIEPILSKI